RVSRCDRRSVRASKIATVAPRFCSAAAPRSDRVVPITACPAATSRGTSSRPMTPEAPTTRTRMLASDSVPTRFRTDLIFYRSAGVDEAVGVLVLALGQRVPVVPGIPSGFPGPAIGRRVEGARVGRAHRCCSVAGRDVGEDAVEWRGDGIADEVDGAGGRGPDPDSGHGFDDAPAALVLRAVVLAAQPVGVAGSGGAIAGRGGLVVDIAGAGAAVAAGEGAVPGVLEGELLLQSRWCGVAGVGGLFGEVEHGTDGDVGVADDPLGLFLREDPGVLLAPGPGAAVQVHVQYRRGELPELVQQPRGKARHPRRRR